MLSTLARRTGSAATLRSSGLAATVGTRSLWNVSVPVMSGPGGVHVTKYHIVKPGKDGVQYDDFLLALPEKDQLASFSKEVPLFVRYLKVVTEQEGRKEAFQAFFERAKSGLVVESDVYITTEELLALMWKNGYSEQEKNAIQFTFPSDYKFHYPELAVLFDITEEDTYKFCMRTRIESSHIGELDFDKTKRPGWIRDHWLIFGTGIFIFKFFPFFNYYFGVKVFGTSMWCYTVWTGLGRFISKTCRRNEFMAAQKTAQDVMDGEDGIVESMKRFANDAKCVEYLKGFKADAEVKMGSYKQAMVIQMQQDLSERALKQLQAISTFEAGMGSAMQELVVHEAAASFKEQYPKNPSMQEQAFTAAIKSLGGQTLSTSDDPVAAHFAQALESLQGVDLMTAKGNATGSLAERVAFAQQAKEKEFQQTFMVTASEAKEVTELAGKAKSGDGFDFSQLPVESLTRLNALYTSVNAKVGFALPESVGSNSVATSNDSAATSYLDAVNTQLASTTKQLESARLTAFAKSFA